MKIQLQDENQEVDVRVYFSKLKAGSPRRQQKQHRHTEAVVRFSSGREIRARTTAIEGDQFSRKEGRRVVARKLNAALRDVLSLRDRRIIFNAIFNPQAPRSFFENTVLTAIQHYKQGQLLDAADMLAQAGFELQQTLDRKVAKVVGANNNA